MIVSSKNTYFIDTNVFLRALINDNDEKYREVLGFLAKVKENKLKAYTSGLVLTEIVWTLSSFYKQQKQDVIKALTGILNLNGLVIIEKQNSILALELYKKYNIKYVDCLIYSSLVSLKKDWVMVSFDKDFDKLGLKRVEPVALL